MIDTNRHTPNRELFLRVLEDYKVMYATYDGGICKALCEDSENMKIHRTNEETSGLTYYGVYCQNIGTMETLGHLFRELHYENIIVNNLHKWSLSLPELM